MGRISGQAGSDTSGAGGVVQEASIVAANIAPGTELGERLKTLKNKGKYIKTPATIKGRKGITIGRLLQPVAKS